MFHRIFPTALAALLLAACSEDSSYQQTPDGGTDTDTDTDVDTDSDTDTDTDTDVDTDTDSDAGTDTDTCDPLTDCGGECVDLTIDPANCGACDHDCLGAGCTASACDAIPLAGPLGTTAGPGNGFLSIGPDSVYYGYTGTNYGGFAMVDKDGLTPTCIACDQGEPRETITAGTWVFWVDRVLQELRRAPLDGSAVATLWSGQVGSPIGADMSHVYWWDNAADAVMQANYDGTGATQVATGQSNIGSIAAEGGYLYWVNGGSILELDLGGGSPVTMASGLTSPRSLALDSTHVYFATGTWGVDEAIRRIPRGGTAVELLVDTGSAFAIALDTTHVYAAANYACSIFRIPKDGGTPEVLATGQPYPWDIVLDSEAAYWSSESDASVAKVAK